MLLRNDPGSSGVRNHYLRVRVVETDGKRESLGAVVTVTAGGITQTRRLGGGSSYLSESERTVTFGLGPATRVEELRTRWPGGAEPLRGLPNRLLRARPAIRSAPYPK